MELSLAGEEEANGAAGAAARAKAEARAKKVATLTAELKGQRISALQKRAERDGVDAAKLDEALEADNTKEELIKLIVELSLNENISLNDSVSSVPLSTKSVGRQHQPSRRELGLSSSDDSSDDSSMESLRRELQCLSVRELRVRAVKAGVDRDLLEDARDSAEPKVSITALLLEKHSATSGKEWAGKRKKRMVPHSGRGAKNSTTTGDKVPSNTGNASTPTSSSSGRFTPQHSIQSTDSGGSNRHLSNSRMSSHDRINSHDEHRSPGMKNSDKSFLPAGKHAMLSYSWADQENVKRARTLLGKCGVECWMVSRPRPWL